MNGKLIKAKDFYSLLCAVGILLLFFGCTSGNIVKIGLLAPFSGPMAGIGEKARNGALLAIDEVNALGGIKGRNVALLLGDDGGNPEVAGEAARELSEEGVVAVIGPYFSSIAQEALDVFSEDIIVFSPTVSSDKFREKDDNFILFNIPAKFNGMFYADRIALHHGLRRVTLVWDKRNFSYGLEWVKGFRERLSGLGGIIEEEISVEFHEEIVLSHLVDKLLAPDPEAVVLVAPGFYAALLTQLIRNRNPDIPVFPSEGASNQQFITIGGSAVEGIEMLTIYNEEDDNPDFIRFKEKYKERFGTYPEVLAFFTYETARVLLYGLKEKSRKVSVKDAIIQKGHYEGLQWDLDIDQFGDSFIESRWFVISGGRYVPVH